MRNAFAKVGDDYATIEAGKGLEEVEWFLLEAERMYPSALFFPRVAIEDVEILGYTIPKDTVVFYSPYMSHRDPATFPNPNAFDPERWNPANENRPSPSKLHGFGGGPRVCLGKSFAKLQLKLMIQSVLENTRIEPDPTSKTKIMGVPVHHPVGSRIRFVALGS